MSNFELIDDYLSNRLSGQDRSAFEQSLSSDAGLKADLEAQEQIVRGVQHARAMELKAMLAKVPVGGSSSAVGLGKIAAVVMTAGVIGSLIYYYASPSKSSHAAIEITTPVTASGKASDATGKGSEQVEAKTPQVVEEPKKQVTENSKDLKKSATATKQSAATHKAEKQAEVVNTPASQPKIEVVDPSADMENSKSVEKPGVAVRSATGTASRIAVDTDASNKKYNFHYLFSGSKLMLYGPFDKSLYEILEINGDQKSVFLYYKNQYYLLSDKQNSITPLVPIRDASLVKKLKEYRDSMK